MTKGDAPGERLDLLARPLPSGFEIRFLMLEPGDEVAFEPHDWRGAIVEVECGDVELHLRGGRHFRVRSGDVLWLSGLGVRRLTNPGTSPAALTGLARTR